MKNIGALAVAFVISSGLSHSLRGADDTGITWLVNYEGAALPGAEWTVSGKPAATIAKDILHLLDDSTEDTGCYRTTWQMPDTMRADTEIVVDVTVRVKSTTGVVPKKPTSQSLWPWRDGAPVSVLLSDGKHQEGIVFYGDRIATWTDRVYVMETNKAFHTYRLVINGPDMSVSVDDRKRITGQNAFWKPAENAQPFIQFGSNSKGARGDAEWRSVRLVRKAAAPPIAPTAKITLSEPWPITRPDLERKPTRPYVSDAGDGKLLMSIAEGPDAIYEPYRVMKSPTRADLGSVPGLDFTNMHRLPC